MAAQALVDMNAYEDSLLLALPRSHLAARQSNGIQLKQNFKSISNLKKVSDFVLESTARRSIGKTGRRGRSFLAGSSRSITLATTISTPNFGGKSQLFFWALLAVSQSICLWRAEKRRIEQPKDL